MLEQRQAGLLPQSLAEQDWRVHGGGENGRSYRLRHVVGARKFPWAKLKMNLEAGGTRIHPHVVVLDLKFIQPLDVNGKRAAAHSRHGAVQLEITSVRRDV